MNVSTLAKLIDVHPDTVRRWCKEYQQFMSPTATPQKGKARVFTAHDAAILSFIATSRESNLAPDEIRSRLQDLQSDGWKHLPEVPSEWFGARDGDMISVDIATARASQVAQIAALQTEMQHVRQELFDATERAELAEVRVENLQTELDALRAAEKATQQKMQDHLHTAQLELERARADVARLEGQLGQYTLGRAQPLNVGLIILVTAVTVAVLVIALLIVVRLVV